MDEMPPIDVRADLWAIVHDILRGQCAGARGLGLRFAGHRQGQALFRSRSCGRRRHGMLPTAVRAELEDAFSESDLPWRVDIVDWATTGTTFRAIIIRDKVVVQRANAPVMPRSTETVKRYRLKGPCRAVALT